MKHDKNTIKIRLRDTILSINKIHKQFTIYGKRFIIHNSVINYKFEKGQYVCSELSTGLGVGVMAVNTINKARKEATIHIHKAGKEKLYQAIKSSIEHYGILNG